MVSKCRNRERSCCLPWNRIFFLALCHVIFLSVEAFSFQIPETLVYDLTWTGLKVGEAALEINDGEREVNILSRAKSAKWVSVFYTVNDRAESRLLKDNANRTIGQPVVYKLNLREGKRKKNREVNFNHAASKAVYIDHPNNERAEVAIPSVIFDPLSSFYYLRTMNLEVGKSVHVTIFDSKKVWNVEVQVLRREQIKVPAGGFNTIVIKPLMKSEGIFHRKGDVYIWLTDDEKRIPVMLKTKVKIGSVTAALADGKF